MFNSERISRLLKYKNLLYQLKALGFVRVFSDNIADSLDISSSLVRRDFSAFEIKGNQKGGYQIETVLEHINDILGKSEMQKVIIVGAGRIGEALMHYTGFQKEGIKIVAAFDIDLKKISDQRSIPVLPLDQLKAFVAKNDIRIAVMATPELAAQQTIELLKDAGIRGILSFSALSFKSGNDVTIANINIEHELENLIYRVNNLETVSKSK